MSRRKTKRAAGRTPTGTDQAIDSPGPTRRAAYVLLTLAVPFLVLGLLEVGLRIGGYGHDLEPLFIPSPQHPEYLQANPRVVARFFTRAEQAPNVSIETAYFRAQKAAGTFRVFVQGESSAAGFPYGLGASIAGVLDERLERAFPTREVEVISTAMAAVNSYALLDFADEILAQKPDAVVIYVGHNEYLGILGVGSTLRIATRPWLTRAFLAAREWRLFQLMGGVVDLAGHVARPVTSPSDTLMAYVAGERSIPLNSEAFRSGLEQFEFNLGALLEKYRRAGVPVFIGTLVSNERDQMPLAVLSGAETDSARAAKTAYLAAQDAEGLGDFDSARQGFAWARDLDPLRFRAPAIFNDIVATAAKAHGATLVDVHRAFVEASPHGLVGSNLILEHVHPNLEGYALLAGAFFEAMVAQGVPGRPEIVVSSEEARREMPVSDIDRWLGEYKVERVRSAWPFTNVSRQSVLPTPRSEGERLAQELYAGRTAWPQAQDALRRYYQSIGNKAEYARGSTILADAFPFTSRLQFESAAALIEADRPLDALRYARRALELEPRDENNLLVTAHALLLTGRRQEGRAALEQVLQIDPQNPTAQKVLGQLKAADATP